MGLTAVRARKIIIRALAVRAGPGGGPWGHPPGLYTVSVTGRTAVLREIPVPAGSWDMPRPGETIARLARALEGGNAGPGENGLPAGFRAVCLAAEGDLADGPAATRLALSGKPVPDHSRFEALQLQAVDRDGYGYDAWQSRDGTRARQVIEPPGSPAMTIDGTVPCALSRFVSAASSLPARHAPALKTPRRAQPRLFRVPRPAVP